MYSVNNLFFTQGFPLLQFDSLFLWTQFTGKRLKILYCVWTQTAVIASCCILRQIREHWRLHSYCLLADDRNLNLRLFENILRVLNPFLACEYCNIKNLLYIYFFPFLISFWQHLFSTVDCLNSLTSFSPSLECKSFLVRCNRRCFNFCNSHIEECDSHILNTR